MKKLLIILAWTLGVPVAFALFGLVVVASLWLSAVIAGWFGLHGAAALLICMLMWTLVLGFVGGVGCAYGSD